MTSNLCPRKALSANLGALSTNLSAQIFSANLENRHGSMHWKPLMVLRLQPERSQSKSGLSAQIRLSAKILRGGRSGASWLERQIQTIRIATCLCRLFFLGDYMMAGSIKVRQSGSLDLGGENRSHNPDRLKLAQSGSPYLAPPKIQDPANHNLDCPTRWATMKMYKTSNAKSMLFFL